MQGKKRSIHHILSLIVVAAALMWPAMTYAQYAGESHGSGSQSSSSKPLILKPSYCWKVLPPLGLREMAPMDTLPINYYRQSVPSMVSAAWATTGNLGGQGMNMIFEEREPMSDFFFRDALTHWMPTADKMRFYNTRIPMTLLSYNFGGGRDNAQDRLQATFSGNVNRKLQIGAMLDYLYSKGSYANQADKQLSWGLSGSYIGDRYELQAYYNHWDMTNKENGGITDMKYITDPAELQGGVTTIDAKSIPTRLSAAHNRLWGGELYINNRYKVGYWRDLPMEEGDTIERKEYVPVTSFVYTLKYNNDKHLFRDTDTKEIKEYFQNTYLNPDQTRDITRYWSITNTLGISLLEGFHKYAKFGLSAYLTHQVRHYGMPNDTLDHSDETLGLTPFPEGIGNIKSKETQQLAWVGAQLTKQQGSILTYEATAEFGLLGEAIGEVKANGRVNTRIPLFGDSVDVAAFGSFRNVEAPYLAKNFISNHYMWKNDMGKQRTVTVGGELRVGRSNTYVRASVSNLQNHIFWGEDGTPQQHSGSVQVLSVNARQNFKFGILHWDNSVTYQKSSNESVISIPQLAVYSNLYLLFRIATLHVQMGVDCDYYTKYYAPNYLPSTTTFARQREMKLGNYPFCNAYLNMKLSKTRFYVMYSHANKGLFGGDEYFALPYYPLNPSRLQMGISVDFAN